VTVELAALNLYTLLPLDPADRDLLARWRVAKDDPRAVSIVRVGRVQRWLNERGANLVIDGSLGGRTLRALYRYPWSDADRSLLVAVLDLVWPSDDELRGLRVSRRDPVHPRATLRRLQCCLCGEVVVVQSATTPHPEAPEMFQLPSLAWIGVVRGDEPAGSLSVVVTCSDACLRRLLAE
jgi:hypothetical protein